MECQSDIHQTRRWPGYVTVEVMKVRALRKKNKFEATELMNLFNFLVMELFAGICLLI